ncbi:MAG: hypothetical protein P1P83_00250 [Bacteroidales bacterium]|nr:hypothetical protein [Bacteroidales bacterium]MDT8372459.1 hypothetical protein [Bacteroidales bacterium]
MSLSILKWFTRILAIAAILFLVIFSLEVFSGNEPFGKKLAGFLIHNIPALLLIIALIIAWRQEIAGGVIFLLAFIVMAVFFKSFAGNSASLIVISPFFIAGCAFIIHALLSARKGQQV